MTARGFRVVRVKWWNKATSYKARLPPRHHSGRKYSQSVTVCIDFRALRIVGLAHIHELNRNLIPGYSKIRRMNVIQYRVDHLTARPYVTATIV